jgi:hypothetical protein
MKIFKKARKLFMKVFRKILSLLGHYHLAGTLTLVISGTRTIKVCTGFCPKEVWVNFKDPKGVPVCHADQDFFDVRLVPDGFVVVVRLTSEFRELDWVAVGRRCRKKCRGGEKCARH